jgi:hypothetical protein
MWTLWPVVLPITLGGGIASAQVAPASQAFAAELASEAATRTSLLASEGGAGRDDKGFYIGQGDAKLYVGGSIQFRFNATFRDTDTSSSDLTSGFENRRTRLMFSGNATKQLSFLIQTEFKGDGTTNLKDAWAQYKFEGGWALRVGQQKPALLREELVSDLLQLGVERSVTNAVFTQGRTQGIELSREWESFRLAAGIHDGLNADNTYYDAAKEADFAATARVEYKAAGEWKQFRDFSGWREGPFGLLIGAAAHYQTGGETGGTTDLEVFEYTGDVSLEGSGWNAYGAFIGRHRDEVAGEFDDFGLIVQGGVFVADQVELFARYDVVIPDDERAGDPDAFNTISFGGSYYLSPNSHVAQVRFQISWFLDAQSESIVSTSTNTGVVADSQGDQVAAMIEWSLMW